jgi:hypothetical protein
MCNLGIGVPVSSCCIVRRIITVDRGRLEIVMLKRLLLWNFVSLVTLTGPLGSSRVCGEVSLSHSCGEGVPKSRLAVVNISAEKIITNRFGLFGVILHEDRHVRYWTAIRAANPAVRSLRERIDRR